MLLAARRGTLIVRGEMLVAERTPASPGVAGPLVATAALSLRNVGRSIRVRG